MTQTESFTKLRIWHLLLWMACISFVASRVASQPSIGTIIAVTLQGGAIAVSIIVVYLRVRHSYLLSTQPGHWFALATTWEYVDGLAITPLFCALFPNHSGYICCIVFLGMSLIYTVAAVVGRWEWYWRLALLLYGASDASAVAWRLTSEWGWPQSTGFVRDNLTFGIGVIAVLVSLSAICIDIYHKQYRDWMHWCGLGWPLFKWYLFARAYVLPRLFP